MDIRKKNITSSINKIQDSLGRIFRQVRWKSIYFIANIGAKAFEEKRVGVTSSISDGDENGESDFTFVVEFSGRDICSREAQSECALLLKFVELLETVEVMVRTVFGSLS